MFRTALRMPFAVWAASVDDGQISAKREHAESVTAFLNATLAPEIEKALHDLMLYGCAFTVDGRSVQAAGVFDAGESDAG